MKLYIVYRNGSVDLDEYESAIVVAESPEAVIEMLKHPLKRCTEKGKKRCGGILT